MTTNEKKLQKQLKQFEKFMVGFLSGCQDGLEQLGRLEWVNCIAVSFLQKYLTDALKSPKLIDTSRGILESHLNVCNEFLKTIEPFAPDKK
jgi:hypothetical protein